MNLERLPPLALVALALAAGLACQLMLGTSYVAASLSPLAEEGGVAVAVFNQDEGGFGHEALARLQARGGPVAWTEVHDLDGLLRGLDEKRYHGALVLPRNFSTSLESFADGAPRAALVETYANPGASTSGSIIASRAIDLALDGIRAAVRDEAIARAEVATTGLGALTLEQGRFLAQPVHVAARTVNVVPPSGANGLAPTYLAMGAWIGGYLGAIALARFEDRIALSPGRRALVVAAAALAQGALATGAVMAAGLDVPRPAELAFLLALGTWMAYALVGFLTDLFGLVGVIPAFAVLAVGLPASGAIYPAGLLPDFFRALHALDPFTWLVEGLRTTLYAPHAGDLAQHAVSLAGLALAATALSLVWAFVRRRRATRALAP